MTQTVTPRWHRMRTSETRAVEALLRSEYQQVDAYRYNPASIRIRIIDARFEGKTNVQRDRMVDRLLSKLPEKTQGDIINLIMLTPNEAGDFRKRPIAAAEFDDPSPSRL